MRKKNLNEESRDDLIENQSAHNLSSRYNTSEKQNKTTKRIEIDAGEDNEDTSDLLKDVEQGTTLNKNRNHVRF